MYVSMEDSAAQTDSNHCFRYGRRKFLYLSIISTATVAGTGTVSAQNDSDEQTEQETETASAQDDNDQETEQETATVTAQDNSGGGTEQGDDVCEGTPTMSRTSVTTPSSRITSDDPAVVEANFRPDPTIPENCTIIVDLEFSFTDAGFEWGGGANWDQATSDLVVGTFEVRPGEIRDIRAELHTQGAEAGDDVTVVADYELWFEGNRENSVQQSGIRHTIDVEESNTPPEEQQVETEEEDEDTTLSVPGFGIPSALAGISGAGYLLKSKLTDTDNS